MGPGFITQESGSEGMNLVTDAIARAPLLDGEPVNSCLIPVGQLEGRRIETIEGLSASEESNHFKVTGTFTISNGVGSRDVLYPAKKFYAQEQNPIAYVDYRLGLIEDVYLVLGDFARDGSQATIKLQVNRMVSWLWLGGLVLTLGTGLAILPDRKKAA